MAAKTYQETSRSLCSAPLCQSSSQGSLSGSQCGKTVSARQRLSPLSAF